MNTVNSHNRHSGTLDIPMTNDYLFKALLQENNIVLRGLLCALLHLNDSDIKSTEITNSIILGEDFTDKTIMLDVNIVMNNNAQINLEMQVIDYGDWPERSLFYLSRIFSKGERGGLYKDITPVHQISIVNFTLFDDSPLFYATYKMLEQKNHNLYSDKLALSVLDLTKVNNATDEDKAYGIDKWARLFASKTWEDLHMLAQENSLFAEATKTVQQLTDDDAIREACFRRDEQLALEAYFKSTIAQQEAELKQKDSTIAEMSAEIAKLKAMLESNK